MNTAYKEKKLFFRFLKEYKCYKEFIKNFHNNKINFENYDLDEYINKHNGDMKYIIDSFDWHDNSTLKLKNNSWGNINDDWEDIIDEIDYNETMKIIKYFIFK